MERICDWAVHLALELERGLRAKRYGFFEHVAVEGLVGELRYFEPLTRRVIWQASERVLLGRSVPNEKKLFSLFEPHTELLKRGKAGKDVEFGHMIQIQQVGGKFITDYEVFDKKPAEPALVRPALESHEALFGCPPDSVAGDKGYWSSEKLSDVFDRVDIVAIPKMGRRDSLEEKRELDPRFKLAQRFRAGIEGSISFLKRLLRLARCMNKVEALRRHGRGDRTGPQPPGPGAMLTPPAKQPARSASSPRLEVRPAGETIDPEPVRAAQTGRNQPLRDRRRQPAP